MSLINEDEAVARLSEIVALECGIHTDAARQIRVASALHDIGKQKIPRSILDKPGKLDEREFEIVKDHTRLGAAMLSSIQGELGTMARMNALYHHEWYDGGGYWGMRTFELPRYVAITAISDAFVALVSKRPYKSSWPPEDTIDYIQNQAGMQFDPALVEMFIPLVRCDSRIPALFKEVM